MSHEEEHINVTDMEGERTAHDPRDLARRAAGGDRDAFALLYDLYFTPVFRYIYFRVRNREEAEDLAQTVFIKGYESMARFKDMGKPPLAFFFTIARNMIISAWRKKREIPVEDIGIFAHDEIHLGKEIEQAEMVKKIHASLSHLTPEQAEVVVLRFINELSSKEIAGILGKSEEAVRQMQSRAIRVLRKHLGSYQI
jgi:RNA polymerase sigma-70 factor (ECF subfamily)